MSKSVIAIDIDDVLFPFVEGMADYHNQLKGTRLTAADFNSYSFHEVWGGSREEANDIVERFLAGDNLELVPVAGARAALHRLSSDYRLVMVTARNGRFSGPTVTWLRHHFEDLFADVVFAGNEFDGRDFRSKHEICQELGAKLMIDDHPNNILPCAEVGIDGILFGGRSWATELPELPANVVRVSDWPEAVEYIYGQWRG